MQTIQAAFQEVLTLNSQTLFWLCYNVLQLGLLQQQWMFWLANCKQYQPWQGWYFAVPWLPAKPDAGFPSYQTHLFHKYLETISTGQRFIRKHINWWTSVCYSPTQCQKPNLGLRYCRCWTKLSFQQRPFPFHVAAAGLACSSSVLFLIEMTQEAFFLKKK